MPWCDVREFFPHLIKALLFSGKIFCKCSWGLIMYSGKIFVLEMNKKKGESKKTFNLTKFALIFLYFHFYAVQQKAKTSQQANVNCEEGKKTENFSLDRKKKNISANVVSMFFLGSRSELRCTLMQVLTIFPEYFSTRQQPQTIPSGI